jgi:Tfp pilus assembly protein PilO
MKQRKPMPRAAIFGLVVVAALLVAFVGYTFLVKPKKAEAASLTKQAADVQTTLDQYRADAAAAKAHVVPKIRVADVYRLARAMPAAEDMPDILIELNDVAKSAGIRLDSISPGKPTAGNGFQIVQVDVQFVGDYYAVTDLLYRLRTLVSVRHGQLEATGRLFSVKHVNLSPAGTKLNANVALETYMYGAGTGAATAAVPGATPTTSTTSTTSTSTPTTTGASAEGAP